MKCHANIGRSRRESQPLICFGSDHCPPSVGSYHMRNREKTRRRSCIRLAGVGMDPPWRRPQAPPTKPPSMPSSLKLRPSTNSLTAGSLPTPQSSPQARWRGGGYLLNSEHCVGALYSGGYRRTPNCTMTAATSQNNPAPISSTILMPSWSASAPASNGPRTIPTPRNAYIRAMAVMGPQPGF